MLNEMFCKYQSLGNDFILLDWLDEDKKDTDKILHDDDWVSFVCHLCSRNFGIGADGVLVVKKNEREQIEGMVFNSDGSNGGLSLNGLRCITHYLISQKEYTEKISVFMGNKIMDCGYQDGEISIKIANIVYKDELELSAANNKFNGHIVDAGNPHFIIFSDIDPTWLGSNGAEISEHKNFPGRTNVEFVWEHLDETNKQKTYCMLVYERGCGVTLACGSGAAAVVAALHKLNKIKANEVITIEMPGGALKTHIDDKGNVFQLAEADMVFRGAFD